MRVPSVCVLTGASKSEKEHRHTPTNWGGKRTKNTMEACTHGQKQYLEKKLRRWRRGEGELEGRGF
jgi:hypothetical protein